MTLTRRELLKLGLAAIPAARLSALAPEAKPDSNFGGVQIGIIVSPYNFPSIPVAADQFLRALVRLGLSAVEIQDVRCEVYAGAPSAHREGYSGSPSEKGMTPAQRAEIRRKQTEELTQWRLKNAASIFERFKKLRRMYDDAGVTMYALRLANTSMEMSDAEYDYFFNAARVLGANQITTELPEDAKLSQRLGELGAEHKIMVGYHNHTQVNARSWDTALAQSKWNGIQLDVGHYAAAVNASPIPFLREHHDRIVSIHLKDRKLDTHGGANLPWGEGETDVKGVLLTMKNEHYDFPAGIELEYKIPEGSTPEKEIENCLDFSRKALS